MKVDVLATGSKGNCIAVSSDSTCHSVILIDAGVAKTKIKQKLLEHDINPMSVASIFITHAHGDHIKGLPIANEYHIPVYASEGEWKDIKSVDEELMVSFEQRKTVADFYPFVITPFNTHHDAYDPSGFAIVNVETNFKVSVCLDTGHVDDDMIRAMSGSNIYVIEANHQPTMVDVCNRPESVKARILSNEVGHLSNAQAGAALKRLVRGNGEQVYLTHLSEGNNNKHLAQMVIERYLSPLANGKDYYLEVVR